MRVNQNSAREIRFAMKKGAKPTAAPFSDLVCLTFCELKRDPQLQPHGAPVVDALLLKAAEQAAEIGIESDIRRVEREQRPSGLIHLENKTAKPCEAAAAAAGVSVGRQEGMIEYVIEVRA